MFQDFSAPWMKQWLPGENPENYDIILTEGSVKFEVKNIFCFQIQENSPRVSPCSTPCNMLCMGLGHRSGSPCKIVLKN